MSGPRSDAKTMTIAPATTKYSSIAQPLLFIATSNLVEEGLHDRARLRRNHRTETQNNNKDQAGNNAKFDE